MSLSRRGLVGPVVLLLYILCASQTTARYHPGLTNPHIRISGRDSSSYTLQWAKGSTPGQTTSDSTYYNAAVVEYYPYTSTPGANVTVAEALSIKGANVACFAQFMQAASGEVDLVVFPEDGLYGAGFNTPQGIAPFLESIPAPGNSSHPVNPCDQKGTLYPQAPALVNMSCLAREHDVAVVFNMGDKQPCQAGGPCMSNGQLQYNTDIALDRNGDLLAKYHKTHLYFEGQFTPGSGEPVTFTTGFGVQFGVLTCFDVMFAEPSWELFVTQHVKHLIFPTWWVNVPPIMLATGVQRAYSYLRNITVLASGSGSGWFNSGTGIYQSGRTLATYYNPTATHKAAILAASVPRDPSTRGTQTRFIPPLRHHAHVQPPPPPASSSSSSSSSYRARHQRVIDTTDPPIAPPTGYAQAVTEFSLQVGQVATPSASVGSFTCQTQVEAGSTLHGGPVRYAVVACNGKCENMPFKTAQLCMVIACPLNPATPCGNTALVATANLVQLNITAPFDPTYSLYPLYAGQEGALVPGTEYDVSHPDSMALLPDADVPTLGAGLFARPLQPADPAEEASSTEQSRQGKH